MGEGVENVMGMCVWCRYLVWRCIGFWCIGKTGAVGIKTHRELPLGLALEALVGMKS